MIPQRQAVEQLFAGNSEMARLMRSHDWSQTPLGAVENWPQSLRTMVSVLLNSRYPMFLFWGSQMIKLYNDSYRPILGSTKHPEALGKPGTEVWPEIWDTIGPMVEQVIAKGEATWSDNLLLLMQRSGYLEEVYFTFSYSPVRDETGGVGGLFCACIETTQQVLGERRLRTLRSLSSDTAQAKTVEEVCQIAAATLSTNPYDIPFALLYLVETEGKQARLAGTAGIEMGTPASPASVDLTQAPDRWNLTQVCRTEQAAIVEDLASRFNDLPEGLWNEIPPSAVVMPLAKPASNAFAQAGQPQQLAGLLIMGISPRREFDEEYRGFFELVASHVATAIANARAYEAERQRAEALAELDRAKTTFFSNVSHEFRTPLTLMLDPLNETLSRLDGQLSESDREQLQMVQRNGQRLLKLVNTLLDFSRIEAERMAAVYEPTDLAALTAELSSVFRAASEQAKLRLIIDCPPLSETAWVDREMWEKMVLNLLSNAFKFTFEGEIAVVLRERSDQIELEVRDTGIGIPAVELPHIFERFHRVRGARGRTYEGSGIGLSLVQELVRLHGGTIRVSSKVDRGTSFVVSIPAGCAHLPPDRLQTTHTLASTAMGAAPYVNELLRWLPRESAEFSVLSAELNSEPVTQNSKFKTQNSQTARILLVDDNNDMRDYVQRLLTHQGYDVKTVTDGMAALAEIGQQVPTLVLADVMMPRLDGFGLLRELRANPTTRDMPIILLSARAGEEARIEGLEAGADDYLTKPFAARELLARVEATLKLAQLRREGNAAIQRSEERARLAIRVAQLGTWRYDLKTNVVELDERMREIWGEPENAERLPFSQAIERIHPDDRARVVSAVSAALEPMSSGAYEIDYRIVWDDGTERWLSANGQATFAGEGASRQAVEFLGTALDISERKQAEAALRESEEKLSFFIKHAPAAMAMFDREMRYLAHSQRWMEDYELTEPIIGRSHYEVFPEIPESWKQIHQNCLAGAVEKADEDRFDRTDGSVDWLKWEVRPWFNAAGEIGGIVIFSENITERKQAEAELKEAQRIGNFGNWYWDAKTDVTTGSDQLLRLYGFDPVTDTLPNFIEQDGWLYPHESWQRINAGVQRALETGLGYELDVQAFRNGTPIWITTRSEVLRDSDGKIVGLRGTVQDITARKQVEAELRQKNAILDVVNESAPTPIFVKDRQGRIIYANPATLEVLGKSAAEVIGARDCDLYANSEEAARVMDNDRRIMESGQTEVVEESPDGIRTFLGLKAPYRNEAGEVIGLIGISNDISDRKHTEQTLLKLNQELQHQLAESKTLLEIIPIGIGIAQDRGCQQIRINSAFAELLGIPPTVNASLSAPESERPNFEVYHHGRLMTPDKLPLQYAATHGVEVKDLEVDVVWSDGTVVTLLEYAAPIFDENGQPRGSIGAFLNITERKRAEEVLREQANLLELAYEAILVRDAHERITFWNRGAEQLYGWTREQAIGQVCHTLLQTVFAPSSVDFEETLDRMGRWEGELTHTRCNGTQIVVESRQAIVRDRLGQVKGVLEVNRDITERKHNEAQLQHQALHDRLTGLPNRALLMERVQRVIERAKRQTNYHFALLFIDLDRFKYINDTLGHLMGDRLLEEIAHRLQQGVRSSDTVARLGGDEFIILLDDLLSEKEAFKITERLLEQLKIPMMIEGQQVSTSGSIGIVLSSDVEQSANELLRNADLAMYSAKEQGKSRYAVFNPTLHARAHRLWELENHLRSAIERQEFLLYYQPILCLTTQTLVGFEALIRWRHPQKGLISPREFISVAEETGLIIPIGEWVLLEACQQLAQWQQVYSQVQGCFMSVNFSNRQLERSNIISVIDQILEHTHLPASTLKLEITETLLMKNLEGAIPLLLQLKERSIGVSIDDFGTGYSSLSYLCELPVNTLKIDRSFVTKLDAEKDSSQVIQAIVGLARQLKIDVIAEGIENQSHLTQLQKFGCKYGQGYFFSQPLDNKGVAQFISTN